MFIPKRIIFLKDSLEYEIAQNAYQFFKDKENIDLLYEGSNIKQHLTDEDYASFYRDGKKTLVFAVKKVGPFQTCKPSADYQLPLVSGCMGQCEYCYLHTQLKDKPFIKVNVNVNDIFDKALSYLKPDAITVFEGTATSDCLPVEPYTKILSKTIEFFAKLENARFRFVSKYNDVNTLLNLNHQNHTEIRFSINTDTIIKQYEHLTPSVNKRIEAAKKVLNANYKVGFLIAPVFLYDNYQEEYYEMLKNLRETVEGYQDQLTFEVISHRFTVRAKETISEVFPDSTLDMDESKRNFRMGQFGYGKYMYPVDSLRIMKEFFKSTLSTLFPNSQILYII